MSRNGRAGKASGPSTARPRPRARCEQLEGDHRVERRLPDDRLRAVLAHRPLVVDHVVQVGLPRPPVDARARDEGPGARLAGHPLAERRRVRERRRDDVARGDLHALHADRLLAVEAELVERLQHLDELVAEAVLERHAAAVDPPRDEQHLLVLDVDALDRADPLGEVEHLGLGERLGREPAAVALPDDRRVEALLDRRPDRERRREVVALDDEVRAVADADLVDLGEQLVGRMAGEDVGRAGLDADPDEREQALLLPCPRALELVVAELHAGQLERPLGMRLGERHRHVEVRHDPLRSRRRRPGR